MVRYFRRALIPLAATASVLGTGALAQPATNADQIRRPAPNETQVTTPIEIVLSGSGAEATCQPGEVRLPAGSAVNLRFANRTGEEARMTAPEFLKQAQVHTMRNGRFDAGAGSVTVAAGQAFEGVIVTPRAGTYPFECAAGSGQAVTGNVIVGP